MKEKRFSFCLLFVLCMLAACNGKKESQDGLRPIGDNSVVYEMNIRQYTPEGTFAAAEQQLPRLKELGIDILWLMPIHPIGEQGRKGSLGSYYAPRDYKAVNPEYGTLEDFDRFLATAHSLGMRVIIDWVANHTAPDSQWTAEHLADWYLLDSLGQPVVQYDWTDIAPLNWEKQPADLCAAMEDAMRFWLLRGLDGFRCDVAHQVPVSFWQPMFDRFRAEFPGTYYLAEGERPDLHDAFDATYAWELHHLMNDIAQGHANAADLAAYVLRDDSLYGRATRPAASVATTAGPLRLTFTSNHDENSWSGTEFERMGDAAEVMAALTFVLPHAQPLIYTGQEVAFPHRFVFFEKDDTIPCWTPAEGSAEAHATDFYRRMTALYHSRPALHPDADYTLVEPTDTNVFTLVRTAPGDTLTAVFNFRENKYEIN